MKVIYSTLKVIYSTLKVIYSTLKGIYSTQNHRQLVEADRLGVLCAGVVLAEVHTAKCFDKYFYYN